MWVHIYCFYHFLFIHKPCCPLPSCHQCSSVLLCPYHPLLPIASRQMHTCTPPCSLITPNPPLLGPPWVPPNTPTSQTLKLSTRPPPHPSSQAMDRAHRLGQTRTVNVYRILMRNTLEERIMGLQQFKLDMANAVVNQDNMSMSAMDTGQLLDLFGTGQGQGGAGAAGGEGQKAGAGKGTGLQAMLASMGEMWDEKEYEREFDVGDFMRKVGKGK